jgi:hypothetical protein
MSTGPEVKWFALVMASRESSPSSAAPRHFVFFQPSLKPSNHCFLLRGKKHVTCPSCRLQRAIEGHGRMWLKRRRFEEQLKRSFEATRVLVDPTMRRECHTSTGVNGVNGL